MNKVVSQSFIVAVLLVVLSGCGDTMYSENANRPIIEQESIADPSVIKVDDRYYLYGTHVPANRYVVYSSADGLNWEQGSEVFAKDTETLWAPDVFRDPASGKFFLYYSLEFDIGVAIADTPVGPFEDQGLLIRDAIDAHMYHENGKYYLYYATANRGFKTLEAMGGQMIKGWIKNIFGNDEDMIKKTMYVQPMSTPTELAGEPIMLLKASQDWEKGSSMHVIEGPWMFREADTYYLMYSGSPTHESSYAVGYATADNPLGPFVRYDKNPIFFSSGDPTVFGKKVFGPGHHSVVREPDGTNWIYFHQNAKSTNFGLSKRYVSRGKLVLSEDGVLGVRLLSSSPSG